MRTSSTHIHSLTATSYDPVHGATQLGYRVFEGALPSTGETISMRAWAIVFVDDAHGRASYTRVSALMGRVDAIGLIEQPIAGITGDRFGNMSERDDLLGERATIWVSAYADDAEARGAVLVASDAELVQIVTIDPYIASGNHRAVHVIEHIAKRMHERAQAFDLPAYADTMSRLPLVADVAESLDSARITLNRYGLPPE